MDLHPDIKKYLFNYTSSLAIRNFKRFLEQLGVDEDKLKKIISKIIPFQFKDLEDLKNKSKDRLLFVTEGKVTLEFVHQLSSSQMTLSEGSWFGTEAISPPFELSYSITALDQLKCYSLDLEYIREYSFSIDVLQKLEEEPYLRLSQQEDDQYLNDIKEGSIPGQEVPKIKMERYIADLNLNLSSFSFAKGNFDSYSATLRNFCKLHGIDLNTANCNSTLKRYLPNLNLSTILEVLKENDFVAKAVNLQKRLGFIKLPVMVIYQNRLILLFHEYKNSFLGLDPVHGYFKIAKDYFFELPELEVIEANLPVQEPEDMEDIKKYEEKKETSKSWEQAKALFKENKRLWIKTTIVSILIFLINIIPPFISQEIIDEVIDIKDIESLYSYGIGLVLCYFAIACLSYYRGRITSEFSYLFDYDFSAHFYNKLLKLKANFFGDNRVGEVFARIGELTQIREFFSGGTVNTIINLITALIYGLILLFYSWKIALIPFAAITVIALLQYFIKKRIRNKYLEHFSVDKKTQSKLSEMINSIATVKAFMSEKGLLDQYEDHFLQSVRLRRDLQLISSLMSMVIGLFSHIVRISAIWVGVLMIFKKELSIGELFSINMFISRVLNPLNSLVEFLTNLEEVKVSLKKLDDVFGYDFKKDNPSSSIGVKMKGRIHLDRVSFKYDEQSPDVLKDVDLTIYPKQVVAIVGESGCGKTTLANIIAGNLPPTKGKIFFDGMDQRYISLTSLKSQVGFIQQNNDLFSGSIESNVTYAHTYTNELQLSHALEVAHCNEFIDRFPTGLKQFLAEGGMGLSGGQKQRLSIARTLYNNPKILILDEATSALDSESESVLIDNMKKLAQGKTTILIAHRLSTIRHADQVFVMEEGKVVESGNHHDLVQKRGKYYELFKEQMR